MWKQKTLICLRYAISDSIGCKNVFIIAGAENVRAVLGPYDGRYIFFETRDQEMRFDLWIEHQFDV